MICIVSFFKMVYMNIFAKPSWIEISLSFTNQLPKDSEVNISVVLHVQGSGRKTKSTRVAWKVIKNSDIITTHTRLEQNMMNFYSNREF